MSRIGVKPIPLATEVSVTILDNIVTVKGPKGELKLTLLPKISAKIEENQLIITKNGEGKQLNAYHGLIRSLLKNYVQGVSLGFKKTLELVGTGYRVTKKGTGISLALGFSHPVEYNPPAGITLTPEGNNKLHIEGYDKQLVGEVAAKLRSLRPPEPYQGKGIRYHNEVVRRKAGKAAVT